MLSPGKRTIEDVIGTIASIQSGKTKAMPEALPEAVHVEAVPYYDETPYQVVTAKPLMVDDSYTDMVIKEIKELQTIALDRNKENSDLLLLLKEIISKHVDPKKNLDTHKKTMDDELKEHIGVELREILEELMKKDGSSSTWLRKFIENQASGLIKEVEQLQRERKSIDTLKSTETSNDSVKCFSDKLKYILEIKIMDLSKKDEYPPYLSKLQNKLEQYYGELTRFADNKSNSRERISIIKEFMKKPSSNSNSNSKLQEAAECALHVFLVKQLLYGCEATDPEDCNTSQIQSIVYRFYEKISSILKPADSETPVDNRLCDLYIAMFKTGNYMSFFDGFDEETVNQTISNPDLNQDDHRTILKIRTIINNSYFKIRECFLEKCCLDEDDRECEDCDSVVNPDHNEPPLSKQRSELPPAPASAPPLLPPTPRAPPPSPSPSRSPSPSQDSLNSEDVTITENLLLPRPPSPPPVESDTTQQFVSPLTTRPTTAYTDESNASNDSKIFGLGEKNAITLLGQYVLSNSKSIKKIEQGDFLGANHVKDIGKSKKIYGMLLFEEDGQSKTLLGVWEHDEKGNPNPNPKTINNCKFGVVRINDADRNFDYKIKDGFIYSGIPTEFPSIDNFTDRQKKDYNIIVAKLSLPPKST
jgi:hypothetical protein